MNSFNATPNIQRTAAAAPRAVAGARVVDRGATDLRFWGLALIAMGYILYVPTGPQLFHSELVYGPNALADVLRKVWAVGRYFAAIIIAPLLLMTRTGVRPLARCWPALPFAVFAAASIAWSAFPKESLRESLNLFAVLVTISTLVSWYGLAGFGRRVHIVTAALMIASVATALLLPQIGVHHGYDFSEPVHAGKWRGVFAHKNTLGEVSVTAIVLSLRSIRNETRLWKAFFILGRVCALLCCLMAHSSTSWGGALIAVTFFMFMKNRATSHPIFLVAMILVGLALIQGLSLNAGHAAQALGRDSTFTGRTEIWALGRSMIENHLMLGSGYASDPHVFGALAERSLFSSAADLHSGYLDLLFNLGVIGAVLMFIAVGGAALRGYIYAQRHAGDERDQAVVFLSLIIAACAIAFAEVSPFAVMSDGAVGLWTAVPALYQLGATARKQMRSGVRRTAVRARTPSAAAPTAPVEQAL